MDEQNKDTEEQIKFTQLLKELADTQVTLAKINAQLAIRESKDQIETIVDSKSKELIEQAKKFGAKLEKIEQEVIISVKTQDAWTVLCVSYDEGNSTE